MSEQLLHGLIPRLRAWWRSNRRLGVFIEARKAGLSDDEARAAVDRLLPPTTEDLLYEMEKRIEIERVDSERETKRGQKS